MNIKDVVKGGILAAATFIATACGAATQSSHVQTGVKSGDIAAADTPERQAAIKEYEARHQRKMGEKPLTEGQQVRGTSNYAGGAMTAERKATVDAMDTPDVRNWREHGKWETDTRPLVGAAPESDEHKAAKREVLLPCPKVTEIDGKPTKKGIPVYENKGLNEVEAALIKQGYEIVSTGCKTDTFTHTDKETGVSTTQPGLLTAMFAIRKPGEAAYSMTNVLCTPQGDCDTKLSGETIAVTSATVPGTASQGATAKKRAEREAKAAKADQSTP